MKTLIITAFSAVTLMTLIGCVQAPPPPSSTTEWTAPGDAQKQDKVWEAVRAGTPVDLSTPLSLADIADLALQNNAATSKAWHEARAASEQVRFAQGYFMPSLNVNAGASRSITSADPESFDQDYMTYGPGVQLSYLVFNFGGGRRAAVDQALQTVYASNFAFNRAIQDTLLTSEIAYYRVITAQAAVEATTTNALDTKAILEAATERRNAGVGVDLDVLQAQTLYDQALYAQASALGALKISWGLLAQSLGLPADTPLQIAPPSTTLPASLSAQNMQRFMDAALTRRPDLAALRASLAAREASIKVAKASRWPSLYLTGSANRNYYELYGVNNRVPSADEWAYMGGVSVKWNIFDGFQTLSTTRTAEAQADATRAQLKQAELGASAEIWTRFQNYETALSLLAFSGSSLKSATAAWELAMDSYKAGLKSILDVLNAETQLANARRQQIAARQEVFTALANLAHATGIIEKGGSLHTQESLKSR
jgi:TolC family type I secretion outer membrane protein